jgi:phosphatidylethanolamine/phosphatidyl-N-methylethanolamine N-methyltransferase
MTLSLRQHGRFASHPGPPGRSTATGHGGRVDAAYARLSPVYDLVFGALLQQGRRAAIRRLAIGREDHVLEVGTGTGINTPLYPPSCYVTAIDRSLPMLERARARVARQRLTHIELFEQDAARMTFADNTFDCVYAPYVISVVPDPVRVAKEMRRVCRPGGRIVFLNHFRSASPLLSRLQRLISPLTVYIGFRLDLDLMELLEQASLRAVSIEKVNVPAIWSLVTCVKE